MNNISNKLSNVFIVAVVMCFLLPLCSASLGTFKQNDCVQIRTILNTSSVNISTINYPNSTLAITNQEMTKISSTFNYSFCNTSYLGTYIYDYFDSEGNVYVNDFIITNTGNELNTSNSMIIIVTIVILIIILIIFFIFGMAVSYPIVKIFCLSITVLLLVFTIGYLLKVIQTTMGEFDTLVSGFTPIYIVGIVLLGGWGIGIILYLIVFSLKLFYKSRGYID
jgi:hypothetical protein